MDTSRFKRRATQTHRQTQKRPFVSPVPVTEVVSAHPQAIGAPPVQAPQPLGSPRVVKAVVGVRPRRPVQPLAPLHKISNMPVALKAELTANSIQYTAAPSAQPANPAPLITNHQPRTTSDQLVPSSQFPVHEPEAIASDQPSAAARRPLMDMELPGQDSPSRLEALSRQAKWRHIRRWGFRSAAVAMVLLIAFGGLLFSQSYLKLHKVFKGGTGTAEALKSNVNPDLLKGEGDGRVNILLLGRGGGNHDGPDLTDTMMLVSVDPVNHTSTLLSIPRDLYVNVPGGGSMKINGAWETGEFAYLGKVKPGSTDPKAIQAGFDTVDQTIKSALGVNIHYNVLVNFQAFQQAIDTVSGVDVNVPTNLVDPTMAWENGNNPLLAKAGLQTFDGVSALRYVRSRETSSDFARAQRQRAVMLALKGKVETLGTLSNPLKISGLLSAFGNNVSTDMSLNNANRLYSLLKKVSDVNTTSVGIGDQQNNIIKTVQLKGQSVVVPIAGQTDFSGIQAYVRSQLKDPYVMREHAKVLVLNGSLIPGLATKKANELRSYGYNIVGTANTPSSGWTQTTLVDLTHKNKYTKHYLEQRLGVTAADSLQDTTIATNGADFAIIIGSDEANTPQN